MSTRSIFPGITIPKISIPKISIPRTTIPRSQFPGPQFQDHNSPDHNSKNLNSQTTISQATSSGYIQLYPITSQLYPITSSISGYIQLYPVTSSHIRLHPVISPLCLNYLAGHVWIVCDDGVHMSSLTHLYILRSINGPHIQGKALSLRLLDESRELQVI